METVEVALPCPLFQTFSYEADTALPPGTRVLVPFGSKQSMGVVLGNAQKPKAAGGAKTFTLKKIRQVVDETPQFSPTLLNLASWMSRYYIHPIGEVLNTMLPFSFHLKQKTAYRLTIDFKKDLAEETRLTAEEIAVLPRIFVRTKKLAEKHLQKKLQFFLDLTPEAAQRKIKQWVKKDILQLVSGEAAATFKRSDTAIQDSDAASQTQKPTVTLNDAQRHAVDSVMTLLKDNAAGKPWLLHGVTGSGKTEVFLHTISAMLQHDAQAQALVLVPEISLTPQMIRHFTERFGDLATAVHSRMSATERWQNLESIRRGEKKILIGPRSAVFAPFIHLRLVVVDEEHDSSYKQDSGLRYHGRDVAVMRSHLEKCPVILASATPSMESMANAAQGKYHLLQLPTRAGGQDLPQISLVQSRRPFETGILLTPTENASPKVSSIPLFAPESLAAIQKNLEAGQQTMVIIHRRGFTFYLYDMAKRTTVSCPECSISLVLHQRNEILRCHYCDYQTTYKKLRASHPDVTYLAVGFGSERAEESLKELFPTARIARLDADTTRKKDGLTNTLQDFRAGSIDILVGTQILAKGHDFPKVTLVIIVDIDELLCLPDFRGGERTFQLLVQAAGRAGRAHLPGNVVVQSMRPDHPVVRDALNQDYFAFAQRELKFRQELGYPPFQRMATIELQSEDAGELIRFTQKMALCVDDLCVKYGPQMEAIKILGPAMPPIERLRGKHRRCLMFLAAKPEYLHFAVQHTLQAVGKAPPKVDIRVDIDPQSLL